MPKAALLIEDVCEIEERGGLFYIVVTVGEDQVCYAVRPHIFIAAAKIACGCADAFMRDQAEPLRLAG